MIKSGAFAYERFRVTERDLSADRVEELGNFVLGVPQGQLPDFEQSHPDQEWKEILGRILTETERGELRERRGRAIKPETRFGLWPLETLTAEGRSEATGRSPTLRCARSSRTIRRGPADRRQREAEHLTPTG